MSLTSYTKQRNKKKIEEILKKGDYNKKDLNQAIKIADKERRSDTVLGLLDVSSNKIQNDYKKIHNLLILHSTLKARKGKNKENVDSNISANILGYMGGRSTRRTRRMRKNLNKSRNKRKTRGRKSKQTRKR